MRDLDVRRAMRNHLHELHEGDPDTRIVEEMGIWSGSVRIDLAVINGELSGFELKSDSDTLERLPSQSAIYSRVFDRVSLVVGQRHSVKAVALIPSWWGLIVARMTPSGVQLKAKRKGRINPDREAELIARLLWRNEALDALEAFDLAKGWRSKSVGAMHERLASNVAFDDLRGVVRHKLKIRSGWLRQVSSD